MTRADLFKNLPSVDEFSDLYDAFVCGDMTSGEVRDFIHIIDLIKSILVLDDMTGGESDG